LETGGEGWHYFCWPALLSPRPAGTVPVERSSCTSPSFRNAQTKSRRGRQRHHHHHPNEATTMVLKQQQQSNTTTRANNRGPSSLPAKRRGTTTILSAQARKISIKKKVPPDPSFRPRPNEAAVTMHAFWSVALLGYLSSCRELPFKLSLITNVIPFITR
jgi:hypothetical protein